MIDERERLTKRLLWLLKFRKHYIRACAVMKRQRETCSRFARAGIAFCRIVSRAADAVREFGRVAEALGARRE